MNRWLWMATIAMVLTTTTGCLRHHTRGNCPPGSCNSGHCNSCGCNTGHGFLDRLFGACGRTGCTPGPIGWQQGGVNYSGHLCPPHGGTAGHPGVHGIGAAGQGNPYGPAPVHGAMGHGRLGHGMIGQGGMAAAMMPGHHAAQQLQNQPFNPGPPSGAVTYPYYTHRGPRDFLLDNPPSIGR